MKLMYLSLTFFLICSLTQCTKDATATEQELLKLVQETSNYTYYKNGMVLPTSKGGHHYPYMKVKYNALAKSALTQDGKLPEATEFPQDALIVQELYSDADAKHLKQYAIMRKNPAGTASVEGWQWLLINSENAIIVPTSKAKSECSTCHKSITDQTRILGY